MICSGSQNSSCSGLVTTAEPPTNGCSGTGAKNMVKVGDHRKTMGTNRRAQMAEHTCMYNKRHKIEFQAYIEVHLL